MIRVGRCLRLRPHINDLHLTRVCAVPGPSNRQADFITWIYQYGAEGSGVIRLVIEAVISLLFKLSLAEGDQVEDARFR